MVGMLLRLIGLGAVLAAASELWFYPVSLDGHVIGLCVFYAPLAGFAWALADRFGVQSWAGAFWAACLFGFLVEGVMVPVLYEAVPFSIFWTSISWHAVISVACGLLLFRRIAARRGLAFQAAVFAVVGGWLGAWSVELWSLRDDATAWIWTPTWDVFVQLMVGWVVFVFGHVMLDAAGGRPKAPLRWEITVLAVIILLAFAAGTMIVFFPLSMILPALVALSIWLMWRDGTGAWPSPFLGAILFDKVPVSGYAVSLLIPMCATLAYHGLAAADVKLESAALHILWAGPLSLGLVGYSAWHILRR